MPWTQTRLLAGSELRRRGSAMRPGAGEARPRQPVCEGVTVAGGRDVSCSQPFPLLFRSTIRSSRWRRQRTCLLRTSSSAGQLTGFARCAQQRTERGLRSCRAQVRRMEGGASHAGRVCDRSLSRRCRARRARGGVRAPAPRSGAHRRRGDLRGESWRCVCLPTALLPQLLSMCSSRKPTSRLPPL